MSKKLIIIGAAAAVALAAALPLIGNASVEKVTQERIAMLEKNGIKVDRSDNGSSYMETKSHYVFTLEDADAFQNYIATLSEAQVPNYLSAMLDDVVMAADVEYSNILINSDVHLDLYPLSFTKASADRMKAEDPTLYAQMVKMLDEKAFLYHMNYDVTGEKFDGYIKDIDKNIEFDGGKKAKILFKSATFTGTGTLVEPKSVNMQIKNADVDFVLPDASRMLLKVSAIESDSTFNAKNSFDLNYKAKDLHFSYKDNMGKMDIEASQMKMASTSTSKDKKLFTTLESSVGSFKMKDINGSLEMKNFTLAVNADNIDEAAYEAFQSASAKAGSSSQFTMLAGVGVLSKGFDLNVKRLSVEKLSVRGSEMLDGFNHSMVVKVKPDDALVQKIQISPMAMMQNIDIDATLRFSNTFYNYLVEKNQNLVMANAYAKKEGNDVVFEVKLKEGQTTINGQSL